MSALPETMQALVWHGSPNLRELRIERLQLPLPRPGEVLVRVRACGVCLSDIHWMTRKACGCDPPMVPGHEISGTIAALGEGVHGLEVGCKVVGCFIQPCGDCRFCRLGEEQSCDGIFADNARHWLEFASSGAPVRVSGGFGGMAEFVRLKATGVFPLPSQLEAVWAESAILGCAYFTAMGALRHAGQVQPGQSVCVIGCGGVGSCMVQLAKYLGAKPVIAVDVADAALAQAKAMGADHTINSATEDVADRVANLTDGHRADVSFEAVGKKRTFEQAMLNTTRRGGKACFVGLSDPAEMAALPVGRFVRSRVSLVASYAGRPAQDVPELIEAIATGKVDLKSMVTKEFGLHEAAEAYALLGEGKLQGRVVVNCMDYIQRAPGMNMSVTEAKHQLLIGGELVDAEGKRTLPVINPINGKVFTQVPDASAADAGRAVVEANNAFRQWSCRTFAERAACLKTFADLLEKRAAEFAKALTLDQGKPLAQARSEVSRVVNLCRHLAEMGHLKPEPVPGNDDIELRYVPRGVVVGIQPWNFPLAMAGKQLAPAVVMGNTIVLKPSPHTPLTAVMLGALAKEAFPAGVVNIISGGNSVGEVLTKHDCVRHVTFTGSIATGQRIMAACAATLKKVTLELGGNDPAIILPGTDLDKTTPEIFSNFTFNSGQVCTAIKRLYVHESQYDAMVQKLAGMAAEAKAKMGDGLREGISFGPINNNMQLRRIEELVDDAQRAGARIVAGGRRASMLSSGEMVIAEEDASEAGGQGAGGFFYEPTVIADIADDTRLVVEEQFGPVLPVLKYSDVEDAVCRANRTEYGLGGSVWGPEPEASRVLGQLEVGIAWLNCHNAGNMHTPWGAVKQSGLGVGGDAVTISLKEYADVRTTWTRAPAEP